MNLVMVPLVLCVICALGFSFWPIAQKFFGVPLGWAMLILTVVQIPAAAYVSYRFSGPMPPIRNMLSFAFSGALLNGIAIVAYAFLLTQKGDVLSKWFPVMAVMMPLVGFAGGLCLLGEAMSLCKFCAIATACFSIYLFSIS